MREMHKGKNDMTDEKKNRKNVIQGCADEVLQRKIDERTPDRQDENSRNMMQLERVILCTKLNDMAGSLERAVVGERGVEEITYDFMLGIVKFVAGGKTRLIPLSNVACMVPMV